MKELARRLPVGARVLDLGCGAGVPAGRLLVDAGFDVTGVDISEIQIGRARSLVPEATFLREDLVSFDCGTCSFDAVISLYALIHVPLEHQRQLSRAPLAGYDPAGTCWRSSVMSAGPASRSTWARRCSGTTPTPRRTSKGSSAPALRPLWYRYVREGDSGHTLVLAQRGETDP